MVGESTSALLAVDGIEVVYDGLMLAVAEVSLRVRAGEVVALLGGNGAGKSTTLKAVSGLAAADRARVTRGTVHFDGEAIHGRAPHDLARRGIVHVLEGRHVFPHLSVEENLRAGGFLRRRPRSQARDRLDRVYA